MALTFGQVEQTLAAANNISEARRDTFQARLKQWQKMGFPEGVNTGRGQKASYGATQLFQLAFMVRLLKIGLTPERAQMVIRQGWRAFKDSIVETAAWRAGGESHYHYLLIQLDALGELQDPPADHMHIFVIPTTDENILEGIGGDPEDYEPEQRDGFKFFQFMFRNHLVNSIIVEVDSIVMRIWGAMVHLGIPLAEIQPELKAWEADRIERGHAEQPDADHFHQEVIDNLKGVFAKIDMRDLAGEAMGYEKVRSDDGEH